MTRDEVDAKIRAAAQALLNDCWFNGKNAALCDALGTALALKVDDAPAAERSGLFDVFSACPLCHQPAPGEPRKSRPTPGSKMCVCGHLHDGYGTHGEVTDACSQMGEDCFCSDFRPEPRDDRPHGPCGICDVCRLAFEAGVFPSPGNPCRNGWPACHG